VNETGPTGRRDAWLRRLEPVVDNVYHCVGGRLWALGVTAAGLGGPPTDAAVCSQTQ